MSLEPGELSVSAEPCSCSLPLGYQLPACMERQSSSSLPCLVNATLARTWALSGLLCLATCPLTETSAVASSPPRSFLAWVSSRPVLIAPAHYCRDKRCCSAREPDRIALQHGTGRKRRREVCMLHHRCATAGWQVPVSGESGWGGCGGDRDRSSSDDGHAVMTRWGNGHLETTLLLDTADDGGRHSFRCRAGDDSHR